MQQKTFFFLSGRNHAYLPLTALHIPLGPVGLARGEPSPSCPAVTLQLSLEVQIHKRNLKSRAKMKVDVWLIPTTFSTPSLPPA